MLEKYMTINFSQANKVIVALICVWLIFVNINHANNTNACEPAIRGYDENKARKTLINNYRKAPIDPYLPSNSNTDNFYDLGTCLINDALMKRCTELFPSKRFYIRHYDFGNYGTGRRLENSIISVDIRSRNENIVFRYASGSRWKTINIAALNELIKCAEVKSRTSVVNLIETIVSLISELTYIGPNGNFAIRKKVETSDDVSIKITTFVARKWASPTELYYDSDAYKLIFLFDRSFTPINVKAWERRYDLSWEERKE